MAKLFTPVNQVRMTNVAVVRLKKGGKRFEIACYKNKVINWRNGVEKNLDEVLQSEHVFTNVSKGTIAKKEDLVRAFGTDDQKKICVMILEKGQLQVSSKEREVELGSKLQSIATIVSEKCINKDTKRPFPVSMIESALKEINFQVKPNKSAKQQAIAVIEDLKPVIPIERAQMRLHIELPLKVGKTFKEKVSSQLAHVEEESFGSNFNLVALVDPGVFREIEQTVSEMGRGKGTLEILDFQVKEEGEEKLVEEKE